jgi:hypothetical protein
MQQDDVGPHVRQLVVHEGGHCGTWDGGWLRDRGVGTQRPRTEPGRHALPEQERKAETGAVVGRTVSERDPP